MSSQTDIATELLRSKLLSSTNILQYTGLTYKDIVDAINTRLSQDRNFDNFRESSIAQLFIEIFAGTADLINYLLERRAEESFFDTAKLPSSVILLARNLAYDIKRPSPAATTIKVKIVGNITYDGNGFTEQDVLDGNIKIQIPQYSKFEINGEPFLLKNLFSYTLTTADIAQGDDYVKEVLLNVDNSSIELIQGEIKYAKFPSIGNDQHNGIFQTYRINDTSFSNIYGGGDYLSGNITKVGIGSTVGDALADSNVYTIDRRSLLTQDLVNFYDFNSDISTSQKICLIRTSTDKGVEIKFGDGKYVAKGLAGTASANNNIFVQYLSTLGAAANEVGVIGQSIDISDTVYNYNITVEYELLSNITGGSDLESIDSIKNNAPGIFYSLDRLVTSNDYITYLKSLTSPINIQNAIAWGEQDELNNLRMYTNNTDISAIKKLFNCVLFSCIGSMYVISEGQSTVKTDMTDVLLDSDYNEFQLPSQNYMTIYVDQNAVEQIKFQQTLSTTSSATEYITVVGADLTDVDPTLVSNDIINYNIFKNKYPYLTLGMYNYNVNTSATTSVSAFSAYTSAYDSFDTLASGIETSLSNLSIWDDVSVIFNDNKFKFKILGSAENCISAIHDATSLTYFNQYSTNMIGLATAEIANVAFSETGFSYSSKIDDVISLLNKRAQLTCKSVYISPIIQDFYLNGNVYIKQLSNRDQVQKDINDKIYMWLDSNTDFNTEIYISNIVELIEQLPSVKYTDIKIVPKIDTLPFNRSTWLDLLKLQNNVHERTENISDSFKTIIYNAFNSCITNFFNKYRVGGDYYVDDTTITRTLNYYVMIDSLSYSNRINERLFYSELVKNIVDYINGYNVINNGGLQYTKTSDFYSLINDLHKDLSYIIKYNMIDSNGNIAREYESKTINNQIVQSYVKGGYSMGNEIVRLNINLTINYKI